MFKILKSSTYDFLIKENRSMGRLLEEVEEEAEEEIARLKEEIARLKETIAGMSEEGKTSVTIVVEDDAISATPVIRYNKAIVEKLIETGLLNDASAQDKFAVQLSLLTIASEVIENILEAFEETPEEV